VIVEKREFLKILSGLAASGVMSPLLGQAKGGNLKNWAGNLAYGTENLYAADSVEHVQNYVKKHKAFKVLGSRHCFNNIADNTHGFLSLKPMDKIVAVDESARTVTVDAGMTYGQLCPLLDAKGFALHNLASLPHISIAGACSTATHGSGEKNGNLASGVAGIEMVRADGDLVKLSRESEPATFTGAVVGLGALGVITKVTLNIQPTYKMKQYVYENMPLGNATENFDAIEASGYSVSLFTDWRNKNVNEVWIKTRLEPGQEFKATQEFFGGKLATKDLHPIAEISAENCTEQMGVAGPWYERLPHFKMGFTPSAGKELQSEYFVPRHHAVEAILAVERLHEQVSPHLLITEVRAIAADDLWMSPCYRQDCVTIHFTWKQDWPAVSKLLPMIEKELAPFQGRPHWGKLFTTSPAVLKSMYPKMPEFVQMSKQFDPQGKFRNEFLNTNIFSN
jgi:xylitol oxidase